MRRNDKIGKLNEEVYNKIIEGLLVGKYKAGMAIKELELVEDLGVSRTPIREALKKLEEQGLVTDIPYKGKIVTNLSHKDIVDIYDLREVLEGLAGRLASERITSQEIEKLVKYNESCSLSLKNNSIPGYVNANDKFHALINQTCTNKQLQKMVAIIKNMNQLLIKATTHFPGSMERGVIEHTEIIKGLAKRDSVLVEKLIREHVIHSKEEFIKRYKDGFYLFDGIA